ncbi:hypothetical protein D9M71_423670 [compost metagenome]
MLSWHQPCYTSPIELNHLPYFNESRHPGETGDYLEITMSAFAVFGMTADVALAEARKITKTTKPSGKAGCPPGADPG